MSFPRYPKYKASGVEWLGDIPEHWKASSIKHFSETITDGAHVSPVVEGGVRPFVSTKDVGEETIDLENCLQTTQASFDYMVKTGCRPLVGDVLFSKDGTIGRTVVVREDREFVVASSLIIIRPRKALLDSRFLNRLCQSHSITRQVDSSVKGAGLPRLSVQNLLKVAGCFPPLPEQCLIASFLDDETAKIDGLVAEQQRLMELLKEKRQAVISQAVTKGLNRDAPMKPSGNQWLGDVPAHWVVTRLKHVKAHTENAFVDGPFGSNLKSEHFIDGGDVYVIESSFATQGTLDASVLKTISTEHFRTIKRSEVSEGDIVIAKIGAQFGKSSILPSLDRPAVVSGNSLKLTINSQVVNVRFVHRALMALKSLGVMEDIVNATAQPALSLGEMNDLPVLVPPLPEQELIVNYLDELLKQVDGLADHSQIAIDLLHEHRAALISAAVTGQIDVRGLAESDVA